MFPLIILSSTSDAGKKYILDDEIAVRGPVMEPALNILLAAGTTYKAPLINNPEAVNYWKSTTVNANYLSTATTVEFKNLAGKPINIKPSMKIKNVTTGDIIVTSATAADITVTAGTKTSCANVTGVTAAGTAGDTVIILNPLLAENADFGTDDSVTSKITKYATQIFMHAFDESYTAMAVEEMIANGDANFSQQKERILRLCENDLLVAAFQGAYAISSANAESGYPANREMGGIIDSYTRAGGVITNLAGALTLDILSNYLVDIYNKKVPLVRSEAYAGSDAEHMICANAQTRKKINFLDSSNVRRDQMVKKIITGVTTVEVAGINCDIVTVPPEALPDGWITIQHKSQYRLGPLSSSTWAVQEVPVSHRGKKWGISGEYGGVLKYADTIRVIKGITT